MKNSSRWRVGALASAIALLGCFASLEAHALALGNITVQSALGEPLRAEVDIPDVNAEEASSLKARVAPPEAFKAAGLEYNAVVASGLDVKLQRRPDGRAYLRLTSHRPVTEPFVDLIIEASWASGRISRDYTMLLDPPNLSARAAPVAPTAPILSRPAAAPVAPRPVAAAPAAVPGKNTDTLQAARAWQNQQTAPKAAPAGNTPTGNTPASDKSVTVNAGDTAGKIAAQNKPANISLDQMLVALLHSNPNAFIDGNINRIKAGAVLDIPNAQAASAVSANEARQTISAQSKDFNAFRRKLAANAPTTQLDAADRQAGGKVQAKVEDNAPASATPDKLTLSKAQVQAKSASVSEEKIAKEKEAKAAASRTAELSKNIADLEKLKLAPVAASAGTGSQAPSATSVTAPALAGLTAPAAAPASAPAAATAEAPNAAAAASAAQDSAAKAAAAASAAAGSAESAPAAASEPVKAASAPASSPAAVVKPVAPVVAVPPEPGLLDELLENSLFLPGIAALLALLASLGFYRYRQNSKKGQIDSSFLESRLQPDSFFGASGGQRIDTSESNVSGSSMAYTSSQLDAAGDVDPVAEADVYLAYGRDLQAEEILKEALRSHPARVAIHAKLLEIYAKRQDTKAFEGVAMDAYKLTQGFGPEWAYIAEAGRTLDPANPMYRANGAPAAVTAPPPAPISAAAPLAAAPIAAALAPAGALDLDLDLDLDFPMDDQPDVPTAPAAISVASPYQQPAAAVPPARVTPAAHANPDLGRPTAALPELAAAAHSDQSFAPEGIDFNPESFTPPLAAAAPAQATTHADSHMLEFDMSALSLDLGPTTEQPRPAAAGKDQDPLEVKFLLAEEFRALGDSDGARSLAEEVMSKAAGPLKVKAQAFLNTLS